MNELQILIVRVLAEIGPMEAGPGAYIAPRIEDVLKRTLEHKDAPLFWGEDVFPLKQKHVRAELEDLILHGVVEEAKPDYEEGRRVFLSRPAQLQLERELAKEAGDA